VGHSRVPLLCALLVRVGNTWSKKGLNDVVPDTECGTLGMATVLLYFAHIQESYLVSVPLFCVARWQLRLELLAEEDEHVVQNKRAG
jgi:hypothetical protein